MKRIFLLSVAAILCLPAVCFAFESGDFSMDSDRFENGSIFAPWNNPIRQDDPFAPWNDEFKKDDMDAPWNKPFDRQQETNRYLRESGVENPDYYWKN